MKVIKKSFKVVFALAVLVGMATLSNWVAAASGVSMALVIGPSTADSLYRGFKVLFNDAFNKAKPSYEVFAMTVPSNNKKETYVWLTQAFPQLREWVGPRDIKNLEASDWTIKNKKFEGSISVPEDDVEDDTYNLLNPLFGGMGHAAVMHPDKLCYDLLANGFTGKCYDGKNFFDTTHAFGSNKSTKKLTATYYGQAIAALGRMKNANGEPLFDGTEVLTLHTGSELEETARQILNADFISVAAGSTQNNIWKNSAKYNKAPRIVSSTAWFITVEFIGLKPIIFQLRRKARFVSKTNAQDSDIVYMNGEYIYGVDGRWNAGYGLPQLAFGSTGVDA